jgi:hypothetical protein
MLGVKISRRKGMGDARSLILDGHAVPLHSMKMTQPPNGVVPAVQEGA